MTATVPEGDRCRQCASVTRVAPERSTGARLCDPCWRSLTGHRGRSYSRGACGACGRRLAKDDIDGCCQKCRAAGHEPLGLEFK